MDILIGLVSKYDILCTYIVVYGSIEPIFYYFDIGTRPKNYLFSLVG